MKKKRGTTTFLGETGIDGGRVLRVIGVAR